MSATALLNRLSAHMSVHGKITPDDITNAIVDTMSVKDNISMSFGSGWIVMDSELPDARFEYADNTLSYESYFPDIENPNNKELTMSWSHTNPDPELVLTKLGQFLGLYSPLASY